MQALGPFASFIIAAYSISAVTLIALTIWVLCREIYQQKELDKISRLNNDKSKQ